jgi:hypothetical protein
VGRLRVAHPEYAFLNSAVIGYSVRDYQTVAATSGQRRDVPRPPRLLPERPDQSARAELIRDEVERVTRTPPARWT